MALGGSLQSSLFPTMPLFQACSSSGSQNLGSWMFDTCFEKRSLCGLLGKPVNRDKFQRRLSCGLLRPSPIRSALKSLAPCPKSHPLPPHLNLSYFNRAGVWDIWLRAWHPALTGHTAGKEPSVGRRFLHTRRSVRLGCAAGRLLNIHKSIWLSPFHANRALRALMRCTLRVFCQSAPVFALCATLSSILKRVARESLRLCLAAAALWGWSKDKPQELLLENSTSEYLARSRRKCAQENPSSAHLRQREIIAKKGFALCPIR